MTTKTCCKTSVGLIIYNAARTHILMIKRGTAPAGIAPCAGHALDEHASYEAAGHAEAHEELGLKLTSLTWLEVGGFHPGRCRRHNSTGHHWRLAEATVTGQLNPSPREVAAVAWYPLTALQALAERTAAWADGRLTTAEFTADPGLEPVFCHWMDELGLTELPAGDLDRIETLAATPPSQH